MENNLDFSTNGALAPDTYSHTTLQGSGDLNYQPVSPRPAPPAPSAAVPKDPQEQAARLRALLSSHLAEGGAGSGQATGADRLEALIDMLYAMTAPAAPVPAAPAASAPVPAPTAQGMETASAPVSPEAQNSAAPSVPAPVAAVTEPAPIVVSETETAPHFAAPESLEAPPLQALPTEVPQPEIPRQPELHQTETHQTEAYQPEAHQTETHPTEARQAEVPHEPTPQSEAQSTAEETTAEPTPVGETFLVSEPEATQEPTAFMQDTFATSPLDEAKAEDTKAPPRVPVVTEEVLTMDERVALLNPLREMKEGKEAKEDRAATAGTITFNFATDKSTSTLNIPIQPNLSLITFEQRPDEIILKIHLSL